MGFVDESVKDMKVFNILVTIIALFPFTILLFPVVFKSPKIRIQKYIWVWLMLISTLFGSVPLSIGDRTPGIYFSEILLPILIFGGMLHIVNKKKAGIFFIHQKNIPLLPFYYVYFFFSVVSLFNSSDILRSLVVLKTMVVSAVVFVFVRQLMNQGEVNISKSLELFPYIGLFIACIAIYSGYLNAGGNFELLLSWDKEYYVKHFIDTYLGRNNYLAGLMVLILPISIMVSNQKRGFRRLVLWLIILVMLIGLLVTSSRGAVAALVFGYLWVYGIELPVKYKIRSALMFLVFLGLVVIVAPQLLEQTYDRIVISAGSRLFIWRSGLELVFENPLFGIGRGMSRNVFTSTSVHNSMLNAFLEAGFLGGVSFMLLIGIMYLQMRRNVIQMRLHERLSPVTRAIFTSFVVAVVHSMIEPLFETTTYDILFWTLIAISFTLPAYSLQVKKSYVDSISIGNFEPVT